MKRYSFILLCLIILSLLLLYAKYSPPIQINPYQQFESALEAPDAYLQIQNLLKNIQKFYAFKGWSPIFLTYKNGQQAIVYLQSTGGSAAELIMQTQAVKMAVFFSSPNRATIKFMPLTSKRSARDQRILTQDIISVITQKLLKAFPDNIKINIITAGSNNKVFNKTVLVITFSHVSQTVLLLIAKDLSHLNIVLSDFSADISQRYFSGKFDLNIVGN